MDAKTLKAMSKYGCLVYVLLWAAPCEAQMRNANWVYSHWVQFGYGTPQVLAALNPAQGLPASLSDPHGNLLVYYGGNTLRCVDGSVMPAPPQFSSSFFQRTQAWLFLPWPGDTTKVAAIRRQCDPIDFDLTWLMTACVDLTANGGFGAVLASPVLLDDSLAHKLTAVPHANGQDYWILTQKRASDAFLAYRLRPSGVDPSPVVSHTGSTLPESVGGWNINPMIHGNLVANYAGDALVSVSFSANPAVQDTSITELFHFDNATGEVSYWMSLSSDRSFMGEGGAEFSPDGSKLYVAEVPFGLPSVRLVQYDLSDPKPSSVLGSETLIDENVGSPDILVTAVPIAGAPDGRIYIGKGGGAQYLAVIEHPDSAGMACGLNPNGLYLPNTAAGFIAMPNFCKRYHDSGFTAGQPEPDVPDAALVLWPVPAGDELQVLAPGPGRIEVLDMVGRVVRVERPGRKGPVRVDLGSLGQGAYVLRYQDRSGAILARPFVKE